MSALALIGGENKDQVMKGILRKVLSPDLARSYNYTGQKGTRVWPAGLEGSYSIFGKSKKDYQ